MKNDEYISDFQKQKWKTKFREKLHQEQKENLLSTLKIIKKSGKRFKNQTEFVFYLQNLLGDGYSRATLITKKTIAPVVNKYSEMLCDRPPMHILNNKAEKVSQVLNDMHQKDIRFRNMLSVAKHVAQILGFGYGHATLINDPDVRPIINEYLSSHRLRKEEDTVGRKMIVLKQQLHEYALQGIIFKSKIELCQYISNDLGAGYSQHSFYKQEELMDLIDDYLLECKKHAR